MLWPEGLTVEIITAASNTLPLCVPLWKRQEPHDLYALMVHVNYDSNAPLDGLLAQPPVLELCGFATAETVFPADGGCIINHSDNMVDVPQERVVPLSEPRSPNTLLSLGGSSIKSDRV